MNRYNKALKHIKSKKLDEKIQRLEEMPTNNTTKVYDMNPAGYRLGPKSKPKLYYPGPDGTWPDGIPGTEGEDSYIRPYGYWDGEVDWEQSYTAEVGQVLLGEDGKSTEGLIAENGTVKVPLPDGSRSFVLGPLVDGWVLNHTSDAYTNIGYIQKDTREFVLLGRVEGQWKASMHSASAPVWGGTSSGFTAYNENFTLAMAQWFRTQVLNTNYVDDIPYWYSGGVPQQNVDCPTCPSGMKGGMLAGTDGGLSGTGAGNVDTVNIGTQYTQGASQAGNAGDLNLWGLTFKDMLKKIPDIPGMMTWEDSVKDFGNRLDNLMNTAKNTIKDVFDADNAIDYNVKLANNLALSIISGKTIDIPLSKSAQKDLVNNIDAKELANALTINRSTPTTGSEAVNPTGNKTDKVVKGPWGAQGGLNFNYNTTTGELEIVSNKTLRTTSGGESIVKKEIKPNFKVDRLTDIPDPSVENIQNMATKVISKMSEKLGGPSLDLDSDRWTPEQKESILKDMRDRYDSNAISKAVTNAATDIISQSVQGSAQTAIAIRKALQNLEIGSSTDAKGKGWKPFGGKSSDVEKVGGAYGHVTSTTKVKLSDLPPKVQQAIQSKLNSNKGKKNVKESYLSEERSIQILREVKKPYKMPEIPKQKYKMNFSGKFSSQNTPDKTASKVTDALVASGNDRGHRWRTQDRYWQGYETTERMNVVYDKLGHADQAWNMITEKNGWKDREMQEHLNMMAHDKQMLKENPLYESPFYTKKEPQSYEKDPLYKRVKNTLNKELHYKDKPSVKGYPNDPPPEMVNGWHPKFGQRYKYDKLDPQSAEAMPDTGDPEIDANIEKTTDQKAKTRKAKVLAGKTEEFSNWRDELAESDWTNTTTGNKVASTFTHTGGETFTHSAIGGVIPSTTEVGGETVAAPTESQYDVLGFTPLMQWDIQRKDSVRGAEQINQQLDSSEDYTKKIKADAYMKARVKYNKEYAKYLKLKRKIEDYNLEVFRKNSEKALKQMNQAMRAHGIPLTTPALAVQSQGAIKIPDGAVGYDGDGYGGEFVIYKNGPGYTIHTKGRGIAYTTTEEDVPEPEPILRLKFDYTEGEKALPTPPVPPTPPQPSRRVDNLSADDIHNVLAQPESLDILNNLPRGIRAPGKMFVGYLTGQIKGNAAQVLDKKDIKSSFENLYVDPSTNSLSVGGYMQNVIGGESLSQLQVKGNQAVLNFGFAPHVNEKEFAQHPGKYNAYRQAVIKALGPYAADLQVGPGPLKPIGGALASLATVIAKQAGHGKNLKGSITMSMSQLKQINLDVYNYLIQNQKKKKGQKK